MSQERDSVASIVGFRLAWFAVVIVAVECSVIVIVPVVCSVIVLKLQL